jgi:curli production assembly/transport component CsgF
MEKEPLSRLERIRAVRRTVFAAGPLALIFFGAGHASAQELTHRFINPSFGGNPFYSEHLLGIANIHRPKQPEAPADPPPTEEELIASQIRARLLSQLSGDVLDRIEAAKPGETGEFEFGEQRISFTRTLTETQVTFLNTRTGVTQRLVIPVNRPAGVFSGTPGAAVPSAEQALGAIGTLPGAANSLIPVPLGNQ